MSTPQNPRPEHPSTYFVENRSNEDELARVQLQDQLFTASMGGVLPEQPESIPLRHVLDVGCGTGHWLIELAEKHPNISRLVGVDVSTRMVEFARAQAAARQVDDRVEFQIMDALRRLEFPDASFDLLNQRLGCSFLRIWDWPRLLQEYQRILRADGIVRITENAVIVESNSPTMTRLNQLVLRAFYQAGHLFTCESEGLIIQLTSLLQRFGFRDVQTRAVDMEYRAGTPEGERFLVNATLFFRTIQPFLRKWTRVPDDYEALCQQAASEMQQPDFVAVYRLLTVWGKSSR